MLALAQTAHFNAAQVTIASSLPAADGIAADGSGNIYVADNSNGRRILKETPSASGYTQSVLPFTGLSDTIGIAADAAGNLYIADNGHNRVLKETLSGSSYMQTALGSGLSYPTGVAVDQSGNVYIADAGHNRVLKETPAGNNYTQSVVDSSVVNPIQLAVDASGNLYITSSGRYELVKETLSAGIYTQSPIPVTSNVEAPWGVAVDALGNIYIADVIRNMVWKETPTANGYAESTVGARLHTPMGLALDGSGNLFVADRDNHRVVEEGLLGWNFGGVKLGTQSAAVSLLFSFDSPGEIGGITVSTQGVANRDFSDAGTGDCWPGRTYWIGDICSVDVRMKPVFVGPRFGAAVLTDDSGKAIATGYAQGMGVGSRLNFQPSMNQPIPVNANQKLMGVAVDSYVSPFVSDSLHNQVVKVTLSNSSISETSIGSGLNWPSQIAIDGSGSIYIADTNNNRILKETPKGTTYVQSTLPTSGLNLPNGVAVDGSGTVFIADSYNYRIIKEVPSGGSYVEMTVAANVRNPTSLAVDGKGNLYVIEYDTNHLLKETPTGSGYTQTTIAGGFWDPFGLAVDSSGNLYVADAESVVVILGTPTWSGNTSFFMTFPALFWPMGVAVDGFGDLWVASGYDGTMMLVDSTDPPALSFDTTAVGSTSSKKVLTVQNMGNAPLKFTKPTRGTNPSIPANFSFVGGGPAPCPLLTPTSANATLAPGATCFFTITFNPTVKGDISGSLVLSDDTLSAGSPLQQTFMLRGRAVLPTPVITWSTPPAITYGTGLGATQLKAVAKVNGTAVAGSYAYSPAAGTVLHAGTQTLSVRFTPADLTKYQAATATAQLVVNKAPLTYTITNASKVYGAQNPIFSGTMTGYVNGDNAFNTLLGGPFTVATAATQQSPAGTYPITGQQGLFNSADYTLSFVNATLTVTKAPLTVTANNASVAYNQNLPTFTYTATGFVNGEGASVLTGTPRETTTATKGSAPGTYPITIAQGTLAAANYSFQFVSGTLTITALGTAATPTFTPAAGIYHGSKSVTISDTTPGAVIYYTTNQSTPTTASTRYTAAISVTATKTIKAIATAPGYTTSAVGIATYTIN